jgi:hypothetical protein
MAKRLFITIFKYYILWLFLFAVGRVLFICWNSEEIQEASIGEILQAFTSALYLDTAMAAYLLVFPFLLLLLSHFTHKKIFLDINKWLHVLLFYAFFLLTISELSIYDEWHTKVTYKALWFFGNPSEVFHTASVGQIVSSLLGSALFAWLSFWLYKKFIDTELPIEKGKWYHGVSFALITPCFLFIGIRGGFQPIPIQISDAYYSKFNVLNLAAVNSAFNLASSCIENANAGEPYRFIADEECEERFSDMMSVPIDTTTPILNTERPNIVLVVLEGWSADMIESCGGYEGVTPFFDEMSKDGILFTDCYASGGLSDQGMAAVFSAFPAQTVTSVITQPNKYEHLPCISKQLGSAGYKTSFMFGGQLSYGNIRSYMYFNEFDKIIEGKDFDPSIPQGKLGAHDEYLFIRQLTELKNEQQPFFAAMFTLSTHGPFDFPLKKDLNWGEKEEDYVNSIYYADNCIHNFITSAKKEAWFKNTLFVFVSDHSHNSPKNYVYTQPEYRRIPMLFYGEVLKQEVRGMKYEETAAQTDLASTLLHQLHLPATDFIYSKNLFNPGTRKFANYAFEEGFGIVENHSYLVWHTDGRTEFNTTNSATDSLFFLKNGQAYLQHVMNSYWSY